MFNIEFSSSTGKKTDLPNLNSFDVQNFCKGINWLQEWKNYYHAYRGDENLNYEDYWYLDISDDGNMRNLNVSSNYIDERKLEEENLSLIVTFSWYHLEQTGWFTKLITGKAEQKVWNARHANEILVKDLAQIIKWFVEGNLTQLNLVLPIEGEHQYDVD